MRTISLPPDLSRATTYVRDIDRRRLIAMVRADPATWKPILLSSAETPLVVRERVERDREVVRQRFETLVTAVQLVPEPRRHIDPAIAAHALVALAEYFGRLLLTPPGRCVDPGGPGRHDRRTAQLNRDRLRVGLSRYWRVRKVG